MSSSSEIIECVWFRCKICKICLEKYDRMIEHIETKHNQQHGITNKEDKPSSTQPPTAEEKRQLPEQKREQQKFSFVYHDDGKIHQPKPKSNLPRRFSCSKCNSRFTTANFLKVHKLTHTGDKPFSCPMCSKSFAQQANCNNHIRSHTGEKPFECRHCGKGFTQVTNMVYHERIHTGEMPYTCETCGKKFAQVANWNAHTERCRTQKKF